MTIFFLNFPLFIFRTRNFPDGKFEIIFINFEIFPTLEVKNFFKNLALYPIFLSVYPGLFYI